jgi:4-amino-4-deoxy-L-arabinose transferase-like glycosyltransferase
LARYRFAIVAVLLYAVLLVGQKSLGQAYAPILILVATALVGMGAYRILKRDDFRTRLSASTPELVLGGLLLLSLGLRLLRLPGETPAPNTDEAHFVESALTIIRTGKFIPTSLRHPPLLVYGQLGTSVLRFVAGASQNLWTWPTELASQHLYGWGRAFVAALGAATLIPLYRIGEKAYSRRTGLLAAFFLAVLPAHVVASGIVTPEVPAAFLTLVTVWCSLRLEESARTPGEGAQRWAFIAGACAGLAVATHYPAALILLAPLFAATRPQPVGSFPRGPAVLLVLVGTLSAFAVACPATLFELGRLAAGLTEAVRSCFSAEAGVGIGLRHLLQDGLGYGPGLLALLGAGLTLPRFRWQDGVLLLFPAVGALATILAPGRSAHSLASLAPWGALLGALAVDRLSSWAGDRWPDLPGLDRWLFSGLTVFGGLLFLVAL